ncbi:hypothetical protein BC829DRAFT_395632, partial [Chytridium lagenaria]
MIVTESTRSQSQSYKPFILINIYFYINTSQCCNIFLCFSLVNDAYHYHVYPKDPIIIITIFIPHPAHTPFLHFLHRCRSSRRHGVHPANISTPLARAINSTSKAGTCSGIELD